MYFRMKLITVNALSTLKRFYKSMILYDEHDNVVWTYGLFG